jgi:preprotein translocase subunit SecG
MGHELDLAGETCNQRANNCTRSVDGDHMFFVSERVDKVDQMVLVLLSELSGNDETAVSSFNVGFSRVPVETNTKVYMFICSTWFLGTFILLFVAVELASKSDQETAMEKSKWLG